MPGQQRQRSIRFKDSAGNTVIIDHRGREVKIFAHTVDPARLVRPVGWSRTTSAPSTGLERTASSTASGVSFGSTRFEAPLRIKSPEHARQIHSAQKDKGIASPQGSDGSGGSSPDTSHQNPTRGGDTGSTFRQGSSSGWAGASSSHSGSVRGPVTSNSFNSDARGPSQPQGETEQTQKTKPTLRELFNKKAL